MKSSAVQIEGKPEPHIRRQQLFRFIDQEVRELLDVRCFHFQHLAVFFDADVVIYTSVLKRQPLDPLAMLGQSALSG